MRSSVVLATLLLAACGARDRTPDDPGRRTATATLAPRSDTGVTGDAIFVETPDGVEATVSVAHAQPGKHGLHLHEVGDCSHPEAKSAGDHFEPGHELHGAPHSDEHHAGDMGNLEVEADGTGTATVMLTDVTIRPSERSIIGKSLVVHAGEDDFATQPSGDSGTRIACGVVRESP